MPKTRKPKVSKPKAPEYIQKKARELQRTGLFKIPELQKKDSGWRIKPFREFRWLIHFTSESKYDRWFKGLNATLEKLGYSRNNYRVLSADKKVRIWFGAREVGSRPSRSGMSTTFDYIRAVVWMTKPL